MQRIEMMVIGRVRTWKRRLVVDGEGIVWTAWLHHPAYGTLGVFLPDHAAPAWGIALDRGFVQITGELCPVRVVARDDDPRAEDNVTQAPLLLHVITMTPCDRTTPPPVARLQSVSLRGRRWIGTGHLAWADGHPALACFVPAGQPGTTVVSWNQPYGVSATIGTRRYLRYLLIHSDPSRHSAPLIVPGGQVHQF